MSKGIVKIRQAKSRKELRKFLTFPWKIYKNDPLWVPPILDDRFKTVDSGRGVFFQRGTAEFFTAWKNGELVGTICTAIDFKANESVDKKECLFGFFECINDRRVANALFDHAVHWAIERDMTSLYGPFNLDYEDGYGVVVQIRSRWRLCSCLI